MRIRSTHHAGFAISGILLVASLVTVALFFFPSSIMAGDVIWHLAKVENDPAAQYFLGRRYLHGNGVNKNASEAAEWFGKAARQGHKNAMFEMGLLYKNGLGVKKNYQAAFEHFRSAAENGHAGAMFEMGNHYFFGLDGPTDVMLALNWYRNAAEKKHGAAQYQLGKILHDGIGVSANRKEGKIWLEKARRNGVDLDIDIRQLYSSNLKNISHDDKLLENENPESRDVDTQFRIGMSYLNGTDGNRDTELAAKWLREAASNNHAGAQYELGKMYRDGTGVGQSDIEAIKWFRKAAKWGLLAAETALSLLLDKQLVSYMKEYPSGPDIQKPDMQYKVGMLYFSGNGLTRDYIKAYNWISKAADNDFTEAQYRLGIMYLGGLGVKRNDARARNWLTRAATNGSQQAQKKLETLVLNKSKVYGPDKINSDNKASELDPEKLFNYGVMYLNGEGVEKDITEALQWITQSAKKGYIPAQTMLANIFYEGKVVDRDYAMAATWYRKLAESGDTESQYKLGILYKKGLGVEKSNANAVKWFRVAARQGHENARKKLGGCKFC